MSAPADRPAAIPFFLPADPGERFCLLHRPPAHLPAAGAIVYVPPFAEEMNKSRRMAAMQARAFAAQGIAVLQIDLYGCGDSSGELRDVDLASWKRDVLAAIEWLQSEGYGPIGLWGLRFGALLAAHVAAEAGPTTVGRLLAWQPVASGEVHLTQFLRIAVAADMLASGAAGGGSGALRKRLAGGETLEVAGYELTPRLAADIDSLRLADVSLDVGIPVDWFEVVPGEPSAGPSPASARVIDAWRVRGLSIDTYSVTGDPFWATVEITDCLPLVQCTQDMVRAKWRHDFSIR